jgi:membrane-bound lytic murein transglycosylase B
MNRLYLLITILFSAGSFADYLNHPDIEDLIEELVNIHNFDESYVLEIISDAEKKQKILDDISSPAEFTLTWDRYKAIFIEDKRITNGKSFIKDNLKTLQKAEDEFGVPKEIITAIIGVETRYGKIQGSHRVIDSLFTLGLDYPRRSKFFRSELINFFLLTRENNLDILQIKGSYAGAMGYGQFISSSYRSYAIDYDNDGIADLFNSVDDAIGSVANYLVKRGGWKRDGNIIQKVKLNNPRLTYSPNPASNKFIPLMFSEGLDEYYIIKKGDTLSDIALKNNISIKELAKLNNIKNQNDIYPGQKILVRNKKDLYFIGDDNFIAITKYNISHFYAMAVYYLSEELKI